MRRGAWALALTAVGIAGLKVSVVAVQAQPRESPPAVEGPAPARFPVTPEERRERLRALRMWRLINVLDLQEGQSGKFFLTLKRYDAEEDRLNGERERLSAALRGMVVRTETLERALLDTMQAIRQQDELLWQARARFHAEVASTLSVRQQARFLLFEQKFDAALREAIFDIMVRRRPGGGWGEGWGAPPGRQGPPVELPR
ncbi:MAG: hypothetical protein A3F84_02370 [Candidatus Handelsmanbacteria bacterium RIFCSPLOWO2_12_FULL_64_10]|uniref:Periplasmic heavy metal sensor n=1 Tax=Handelsmanbacteria sp. (strain RIFCSPLOWO2_12_FULL_64_10) TaxID=1817868 RepID=A0A1F6C2S5_HANXR|nr:MAG: hypothetical protein A3F84_02370 [Candidatus Handelsmanbacteria bacterium RIFCSPLOWO2_12_FULL_64_10]